MKYRLLAVLSLVVVLIALGSSITRTHTPIASRWNYNEHLFQIFQENCGNCHREGGIAPMSLVTYQAAYPWAQSIREEVLGLRMPPWRAEDGFGDFSNGHALSAQEMDMILEWSSGGYPQGPRDLQPKPMADSTEWSLGAPDVELMMDEAFTIDSAVNDVVRYFVLPSTITDTDFLIGADVMPGAGAVVRDVALYVDSTGIGRNLADADEMPGFGLTDEFPISAPVALWSPGQEQVLQQSVGHSLEPGSDIVARIHYKKTWITEGEAFSDQTRVGLYFSSEPTVGLTSVQVDSPAEFGNLSIQFSYQVEQELAVVALLPEVAIDTKDVQVIATTPDGEEFPLLFLREPGTAWPTRYWLDTPITLPSGSTIDVNAVLYPGADQNNDESLLGSSATAPIRLVLDYVDSSATAN